VLKARRDRGENAGVALYGLLPFFTVWTLIPIYLHLNPLILNQHLVPFVFYVGIINAYSVGQMIIAHLTKSSFPYYNILTLPLLYGVLDSIGPVLKSYIGIGWPSALGHDAYQIGYMFLCLGVALGVYGSFVVDVIVSICDYMDIWCLTIKHPYNPEAEEKKAQ
jgi:ethanolaminephosphotransferase